jgi:hypothetical protein
VGLSVALSTWSAHATVIYSFENAGVLTSQVAGATTIDFNNGTCGAYVSCSGHSGLVTDSVAGQYASPHGVGDRYMTVANSTATLSLGKSYDYFGLYWGSLDTYNSISFYNSGSLVGTYGGAQIFPLLANGGQGDWASNRYVNFFFTAGDAFDHIVLTSTNYAFESDNHAFGNIKVPEPGSLAMFGFALLGLGVAARRRVAAR